MENDNPKRKLISSMVTHTRADEKFIYTYIYTQKTHTKYLPLDRWSHHVRSYCWGNEKIRLL